MADSLTDLPEGVLEEIVRRLPLLDSGNLAHLHPKLGRIYRQMIISELEEGGITWSDFVVLIDGVLTTHVGVLDRLSIRLSQNYSKQGNQGDIIAAATRWLAHGRRLHVSILELEGISRGGGGVINRVITTINLQHFHNWEELSQLHLSSIHFPVLDGVGTTTTLVSLPNLYYLDLQHIAMADGNDLGNFLNGCPNLRRFTLHIGLGNGSLSLNLPLLELLEISHVRWIVTFTHLPSLTDFHLHSRDLIRFRVFGQPMSQVPIPWARRLIVSTVQSLCITVLDDLRAVITFIQCFPSLRHLHLIWHAEG
ncbi:uncharacterized protein [Spinacia oleracea]|uniref:Uncharacterized protein isoform X2 n=1 Tax=Spinacia oleracea TaxID=3562 RepID=A0ABM3R6Z6_SPIOL|nr:uncharacterized protein LOC130466840 isoform X2 [Spinacia oleracea]